MFMTMTMLLWLILATSDQQQAVEAALPPSSCPDGGAASFSCSPAVATVLTLSSSKKLSYPPRLKYYVQAQNNQAASILNSTLTSGSTFGKLAAFAYYITKEADVNSTRVGTIRGLETYDSLDVNETTILVLNTVSYNDGVYKGTVGIHGQGNIAETSYELTIVGGTGSFRGVGGYAAITNLRTCPDPNDTSCSDHTFEHVLHFKNTL